MLVVTALEARYATRTSWHFFNLAATLVFGRSAPSAGGGLAVYAVYPKLQFGPFSIVAAEALRVASLGHGAAAASVVMGALAPVILWLVLDTRRIARGDDGTLPLATAVGAALVLPAVWSYLSVFSLHLDDALAVALAALALWGVAKRSDLVVGIGLGLAMAAKPWAAAFLPLVLALPAGRRTRAGLGALGICAIQWLPFLAGASGTMTALSHFTIRNAPDSALRALGVHDAVTPSWDRVTQVVVGAAAGVWCARTGRWPAVLMAAAAVRLAIDPGTHRYYVAGIVVFVLAWELITARWRVPVLSLAIAVALLLPHRMHLPYPLAGDIRLVAYVVVVACALLVKGPTTVARR